MHFCTDLLDKSVFSQVINVGKKIKHLSCGCLHMKHTDNTSYQHDVYQTQTGSNKPIEGPRDCNHAVKLDKNQPQPVEINPSPPFKQWPTPTNTSGNLHHILQPSVFLQELDVSVQFSSTLANISINDRPSLQPPPSYIQLGR